MKAKFLRGSLLWTFLVAATLTTGCSDDDSKDVDGQSPTFELITEHIRTLTGYEFTIVGKVADKDGIRSIKLQNTDLHLDKTIDLLDIYQESVYGYELNYAFTIPEKQVGESFTVQVLVTDLGGRTTENSVLITMDGDYTLPQFKSILYPTSTNVNLVLSEGTTQRVNFTATDDKGLAYVEVSVPELEINDRLDADENTLLSLKYDQTLTFPLDKTGTYDMILRAVDLLGNKSEKIYTVLVSRVKDYTSMFLVDFEGTSSTLLTGSDSWGIPMPIEHTGTFTYKARYYSKAAGTPIRFITSKTNFNICFGADENNAEKLTSAAENMQPIALPGKGYYEIVFNTDTEVYSVKAYTPEDAPVAIGSMRPANPDEPDGEKYALKLGFVGSGFVGAPGWNSGCTSNVYELTQDTDNPYCFTAEIVFTGTNNSFDVTITPFHPQGWWVSPSWRFDGNNESFAPGEEGANSAKKNIAKGTYIFTFDTHLCQSKLIKKQ